MFHKKMASQTRDYLSFLEDELSELAEMLEVQAGFDKKYSGQLSRLNADIRNCLLKIKRAEKELI